MITTTNIAAPILQLATAYCTIQGDTPLITNRRSPVQHTDPDKAFRAALYYISDDEYGFPAIMFKSAIVRVVSRYNSDSTGLPPATTRVAIRRAIQVFGDIEYDMATIGGIPSLRRDVVDRPGSHCKPWIRAAFTEWSTMLRLVYNSRILNQDQIVNMFNIAGKTIGVGSWRPECRGTCGKFHVDRFVKS